MGYTIDAFNMKEERRAGNFDKSGFYVETRGKEVRSHFRCRGHRVFAIHIRDDILHVGRALSAGSMMADL
jgi:hypothetical protein